MPDKAMTKREEAIGRAAYDSNADDLNVKWENLPADMKDDWATSAIAAVAEARRIDTCESCRVSPSCDILAAAEIRCSSTWCGFSRDEFGCNRHEPKGE